MGDLLLVRPGAIGDTLLLAPALAALRPARPADRVLLVAHPAAGPLFERERLVDQFIPRDAPAADTLFAPRPDLARECFGTIAAAVAWSADPDGLLAANLRALGAYPTIVAPSRPIDSSTRHVAEYLVETLAPLGVRSACRPVRSFSLALRPQTPSAAVHDSRGAAGVVLHPGSGSLRKNWPAERFAALAVELWRRLRIEPTVLLGPADEQARGVFVREQSAPCRLLIERPLLELSELLGSCDLYVGNDSGISHLAGLCGAPTLVLFGPTEPGRWRPIGPRVQVLRSEPLDSLDVATVLRAALSALEQGAY